MGRFVIYGAGGVGGVIGSQLFQSGHEVVLVARGAHYERIAADGLRFVTPTAETVLRIPVEQDPTALDLRADDVVMLAMKSQDTGAALVALEALAPPGISLVSVQNGVENERAALRLFPNVYSIVVQLPAAFLEPGVVAANSAPVSGILDIGRYPHGVDERASAVAAALTAAGFPSEPRADISRWKYAKLLKNLHNALNALTGLRESGATSLGKQVTEEGVAALTAAGIRWTPDDEYRRRRSPHMAAEGVARGAIEAGSSSWQSLSRQTQSIEADYLNGEIVLLGRTFGVETPVNALLQRLANKAARERLAPGCYSEDQLTEVLAAEALG
jgi:2-dehydropantoate 2-reductase